MLRLRLTLTLVARPVRGVVAWCAAPVRRRLWLALLSGLCIVAALSTNIWPGLAAARGGLLTAAALAAGAPIAWRAWTGLRRHQLTIDALVTVAALGALIIGEDGEAAAVTLLFLLGAQVEARMLRRTRQALAHLLALAPSSAVVVRANQLVEVAPEEVACGETVLVRSGARIPIDGEVIRGRAAVDESAMTGEPVPVEKAVGASVFAGTVSQDGVLWVRATEVGRDTALARIVRRVEEAQEQKAPAQRAIDGFARWYTPAIIVLSGAALLLTRNVGLALTLLVIACPGALVIATPVAVVAGIGRAARRGILIKGGAHLEAVGQVSALALDKTGTLTEGHPRLTDVVAVPHGDVLRRVVLTDCSHSHSARDSRHGLACVALTVRDRQDGTMRDRQDGQAGLDRQDGQAAHDVLRWAAIAEAGSEHPLARAILAAATPLGPVPLASVVTVRSGSGVQAIHDGHHIDVGSPAFMAALGIAMGHEADERLARLQNAGKTAVLVARDGTLSGILGLADVQRRTARALIGQLHDAGIRRLAMLTGDDRHTAALLAAELGIAEVHAGLRPQDKLALIRRMRQDGHVVAMVGDGINDAPALATADVGIAMGTAGTAVAADTADVVLLSDDLLKIPEAIRLSRATLRTIRQNIAIAVVTVAALLAGVALGDIRMAGGMAVHELAILVVVLNSLRLLWVRPANRGRPHRSRWRIWPLAPVCRVGDRHNESRAKSKGEEGT